MLKIIILILMIGMVSAVDVDFDCPDEIYVGESFECEVEVSDGEGRYDLKVEADEERDSVLRIFDGEVWKSGYYYLTDFVKSDEVVRLKVLEEGRYDLIVKLRDGDWREEFDVGRLKVLEAEGGGGGNQGEGENLSAEDAEDADFALEENVINLGGDVEVISLSGEVSDEEEWDYVSKDGLIVDWLVYGFCLFLIFLVGILMWERSARY